MANEIQDDTGRDYLYVKLPMLIKARKYALGEYFALDIQNLPESFDVDPHCGYEIDNPQGLIRFGRLLFRKVPDAHTRHCLAFECTMLFFRAMNLPNADKQAILRQHIEFDLVPMLIALERMLLPGDQTRHSLPWLRERATASLQVYYLCPGLREPELGLPDISFVEDADTRCGHCDRRIDDGWRCACGRSGLFYCHRECQLAHFALHRHECARAQAPTPGMC